MTSKTILCAFALMAVAGTAIAQTTSFTSTTGTGQASAGATSSSSGATAGQTAGQTGGAAAAIPPPPQPQAPSPPRPQLPSNSKTLDPFTSISLCAPVNILVSPNATDGYYFMVEGEQGVLDMINGTVEGDVLSIMANGDFATNETIKVTVSLPAGQLAAIDHYGPSASIYVAKGFQVPSLNISTAFGAGNLYVDTITADRVNIDMAGVGSTVVTGTLQSVTAGSNSLGTLYLSGVQQSVDLTLAGTSNAVIDQAATSSITGSASGINSVQYSAGTCQMTSPFSGAVFASALPVCNQAAFLSIPPPTPTWTCGIQVKGNFTCRPGTVLSTSSGGSTISPDGTAAQTGTAGPGFASGAAFSSGTGPVSSSSSSAATSSSTGGTGVTRTSTTQGGVTQQFSTSSGGQTVSSVSGGSPGVLVSYGPNDTSEASVLTCNASPADTRIPIPV